MEKITTKTEFAERLKELYVVETKARDEYFWDYNHLSDSEIREALLRIKKDEDNHIRMLGELIDLLEPK